MRCRGFFLLSLPEFGLRAVSPPDLVSVKALADASGLDARTVRAILKRAGTHEYAGRTFRRAEALAAIRAGHDPSLEAGHALAGRGAVAPSTAMAELSRARASAETMRARKLELDVETRERRLVPRAEVEAAARDVITRATAAFMSTAVRVAPRLVNVADPTVIRRAIEAECRAALAALADVGRLTDELMT